MSLPLSFSLPAATLALGSLPSASQTISILMFELAAVIVAVLVDGERTRSYMPLVGILYAVSLPLALWWAGPLTSPLSGP